MSDNSSSAQTSPLPRLPPIISNERDRIFLKELSKFIEDELIQVNTDTPEQRYIIHRAAFDKVIDHVTAYKPILTAIKAEYEECIETILRGKREAFYLNGKLKAMASEPSTVRNYNKRTEELDARINVVHDNNDELQAELDQLRAARRAKEEAKKAKGQIQKTEVKIDKRQLPGLSMEQSTDLNILLSQLSKVEKQLRELKGTQRNRFQPKEIKAILKEQLVMKADLREQLIIDEETIKARVIRLRVALEAGQAYNKVQPFHQRIGETIIAALKRYEKGLPIENEKGEMQLGQRETTATSSYEDDDPSKEKEAELIMDYIDMFNALFDDEKYEAAAIHAANSPKGILRTMDTLNKFKGVATPRGERQPLLAFCDAVMSSVLALGVLPSETMSLECVKCALENSRLDLLSHWISQERLCMTEPLGDMIKEICKCRKLCSCSCHALAQRIYTAMSSHKKVVQSMLKQGRVHQALEYAQQKGQFKANDYSDMLRESPSPQLAQALLKFEEDSGERLVPLGMAVKTLLDTDLYHVGFQILEDTVLAPNGTERIHQEMLADSSTTEQEWLEMIKLCQEHGHGDVSIELLAAVTVVSAMKTAKDIVKAQEEEGVL